MEKIEAKVVEVDAQHWGILPDRCSCGTSQSPTCPETGSPRPPAAAAAAAHHHPHPRPLVGGFAAPGPAGVRPFRRRAGGRLASGGGLPGAGPSPLAGALVPLPPLRTRRRPVRLRPLRRREPCHGSYCGAAGQRNSACCNGRLSRRSRPMQLPRVPARQASAITIAAHQASAITSAAHEASAITAYCGASGQRNNCLSRRIRPAQ